MVTTLGDSLPKRLAAYYTALDERRFADAADCFSADVLYAVPRSGESEVAPRELIAGRAALRARFEGGPPRSSRHEILLCVSDGASCLVEGVVSNPASGRTATFVASSQLDDSGLITRYLAYMCAPAVRPAPDPDAGSAEAADALAVLDHYFEELESGQFEEAADCFSADVLYSHPPYRHTGIEDDRRIDFRGRDELLAGFNARGKSSFKHQITACLQRGPHCLLEGVVNDLPGGGTGGFISSLSLDSGGRIGRYVSFYCEPSTPRR